MVVLEVVKASLRGLIRPSKYARLPSHLIWGLGVLGLGGIAWHIHHRFQAKAKAERIPQVKSAAQLLPPVKVWSLDEANAKLREEARTFDFASIGSAKGRIDIVRVASNEPSEDEWSIEEGSGIGGTRSLFSGIYDGHDGWATAALLREHLISYVSKNLSKLPRSCSPEEVDKAIADSFTHLDNQAILTGRMASFQFEPAAPAVLAFLAPIVSSSSALLLIYEVHSSLLRLASVGLSAAVLGRYSPNSRDFKTEVLNTVHTVLNDAEVERIRLRHPGDEGLMDHDNGTFFGFEATRAFGNHRLKMDKQFVQHHHQHFFGPQPVPESRTPPYMSAAPDINTVTVKTKDFLILGSSGLWKLISPENAIVCISRWLDARRIGKAEDVAHDQASFARENSSKVAWTVTPTNFAIEDLDNAAVCLVKNALGGNRRELFTSVVTAYSPLRQRIRDDITVQVVFFDKATLGSNLSGNFPKNVQDDGRITADE